ncbi:unnamed protein product [Musa acuminata subsp. burmannicoides]
MNEVERRLCARRRFTTAAATVGEEMAQDQLRRADMLSAVSKWWRPFGRRSILSPGIWGFEAQMAGRKQDLSGPR